MPETPDHRTGFATRSGDTHVIGDEDYAEAVNIDRLARVAAAKRLRRPAKPKITDEAGADEPGVDGPEGETAPAE